MPGVQLERGQIQLKLSGGGTITARSFHPPLPPRPVPAADSESALVDRRTTPSAPSVRVSPVQPLPKVRVKPAFQIALVEAAPCASLQFVQTLLSVAADMGLTPVTLEPEAEVPEGGADLVLTHLGCRWAPRLFQPVITQANLIWLLAPPNSWSAVEMRLDQAEFSGWTDMTKLEILTLGQGVLPPPDIEHLVAATLLDPSGPAARQFLTRLCGRVKT